jgi:hypothetical protein
MSEVSTEKLDRIEETPSSNGTIHNEQHNLYSRLFRIPSVFIIVLKSCGRGELQFITPSTARIRWSRYLGSVGTGCDCLRLDINWRRKLAVKVTTLLVGAEV